MRKKTDRLLARVPDIVVKDRSEVEKEDEGDDLSDDDLDERVSRKVWQRLLTWNLSLRRMLQVSGTHNTSHF